MAAAAVVDVVEDAGDGGAFAGAGDAAHQHQTLLKLGAAGYAGGQFQLGVGRNGRAIATDRGRESAKLFKNIAAKPANTLQGHTKIGIATGLQLMFGLIRHGRQQQAPDVLIGQGLALDPHQVATDAENRWLANLEVQVAGSVLSHGAK